MAQHTITCTQPHQTQTTRQKLSPKYRTTNRHNAGQHNGTYTNRPKKMYDAVVSASTLKHSCRLPLPNTKLHRGTGCYILMGRHTQQTDDKVVETPPHHPYHSNSILIQGSPHTCHLEIKYAPTEKLRNYSITPPATQHAPAEKKRSVPALQKNNHT